ncbi:MAG: glucose 1-dehydrogenase [Ruminococcaceae bacterium]|nr:glucose 1-dehydrogenase [Oscillospiraceae bacterium]
MRIFITGGATGIGACIAGAFLKAGCQVCFTYHKNTDALERLTSQGALAVQADLARPEDCARASRFALERMGGVDVLVNNAGIAQQKLFTDITDDDWQRMVAVCLSAPFYVTRAILPDMIRRKSGRIVNVSSMWGVCGASCEVHYSAVKAGLIGMTKALAAECAPSGVTVNAVAPGVIRTRMYDQLGEETQSLVLEDIPLGRIGTPEDVAEAAVFLASDKASFITGQVLGVNGGMVI